MEQLLAEDDKYKVVGFDVPYTGRHAGHDQKIVVAQLCVHHHVLLYHDCLATVPCDRFTMFVNNPNYRFATVDTTNDRNVLKILGLACQKLVDIHDHYKIWAARRTWTPMLTWPMPSSIPTMKA
ncbi:Serine/threonine-protein kinase [Hordeum vulgare]|nr:Serine/threonine-protein kinase [Hordeum vulgare]